MRRSIMRNWNTSAPEPGTISTTDCAEEPPKSLPRKPVDIRLCIDQAVIGLLPGCPLAPLAITPKAVFSKTSRVRFDMGDQAGKTQLGANSGKVNCPETDCGRSVRCRYNAARATDSGSIAGSTGKEDKIEPHLFPDRHGDQSQRRHPNSSFTPNWEVPAEQRKEFLERPPAFGLITMINR